jgi:hypothetical protein
MGELRPGVSRMSHNSRKGGRDVICSTEGLSTDAVA